MTRPVSACLRTAPRSANPVYAARSPPCAASRRPSNASRPASTDPIRETTDRGMRSRRIQGRQDLRNQSRVASDEHQEDRFGKYRDRVVRIQPPAGQELAGGPGVVTGLHGAVGAQRVEVPLEVRLVGDSRPEPGLALRDLRRGRHALLDQELDFEPQQRHPLLDARCRLEAGVDLLECPCPLADLLRADARVAGEHREGQGATDPTRHLESASRDVVRGARIAVGQRPSEVHARPDLDGQETVALGEAKPGLEAAQAFVTAAK